MPNGGADDPASDVRLGYILVRAASMSVEFFDLVMSLYRERGPCRPRI